MTSSISSCPGTSPSESTTSPSVSNTHPGVSNTRLGVSNTALVFPRVSGTSRKGRGAHVGDVGALDNELHLELLGNAPRRALLRERAHLLQGERGRY